MPAKPEVKLDKIEINMHKAYPVKRIVGFVEIAKSPKVNAPSYGFGFRYSYVQKQVLAWLRRTGRIANDSDVKAWHLKVID